MRVSLARVGLLVALTLLGGCARFNGLGHEEQKIAPTIAPLDAAFSAWPQDQWWEAYDAPALNRLIDRALADNPTIHMAEARIRLAQAGAEFTNARRLPQVDASASTRWQRYSENGFHPPNAGGDMLTENRFALDFEWELDFFGRNKAIADSVALQRQANALDANAARLALTASIAQRWFALAENLVQRRVVEDTLAQRRHIVELVQARVALGLDSNVELRQAEGAIPQAEGELAALDEEIALLRSALARLAVVPVDEVEALAPDLALLATPTLPAVVPSDLVARRPDVMAAAARVESLTQGVAAAKAEFYPSINLAAFTGLGSLGLGTLFEGGSAIVGLAPSIRLPLFDAGRLRAKLKFVNAQLDMAIADYNDVLLSAMRDVIHAVISLRALEARRGAQQAAQAAAESAYALALDRFKAGLTGYLTVLATEAEVLRERRAGAALGARACQLDVELKRALGGGFAATGANP